MLLLANGCSHTHGSETFSRDCVPENIELAYPKYIADYFNMDYVNIAQPGCSNNWIVKSTLNWLAEHSNEEVFVLIGWTTFPRRTFTNETGTYFWTPGSENPETCWQTNKSYKDLIKYFQTWIMSDCNSLEYSEEFYHNVKYLNLELKSRNIKHFMVNTWNTWQAHIDWQRLEVLNMKEFWAPESKEATLIYHTELNNCKIMPGGHPDASGHRYYADTLIKVLEEGKLL